MLADRNWLYVRFNNLTEPAISGRGHLLELLVFIDNLDAMLVLCPRGHIAHRGKMAIDGHDGGCGVVGVEWTVVGAF